MSYTAASSEDKGKGKGKETKFDIWLKNQGEIEKWKISYPIDYNGVTYEYTTILEDPRSAFNFFDRGYKSVEPYKETFQDKVKRMIDFESLPEHDLPRKDFVDRDGRIIRSNEAEPAVTTLAAFCLERHDTVTDRLLDEFENPRVDVDRDEVIRRLKFRIDEKKNKNMACNNSFLNADSRLINWEPPVENQTEWIRHE